MKKPAPAGPPVFVIIADRRDRSLRLDMEGRAPMHSMEFEMARATDKTTLQKLYPGAKDLTGQTPQEKE